jgi:hypothetical protein
MRRTALLIALNLVTNSDWALIVGGERICAKNMQVCETARDAIRRGHWPIVPADTPTSCVISPNCFDEQSNCIVNFNCGVK